MCRFELFLLLFLLSGASAMNYVYIGFVQSALKPPTVTVGNLTVLPKDLGRLSSNDYPITVTKQDQIYQELERLKKLTTPLVAIIHTCNFNLMLAARRADIGYFLINNDQSCDSWRKLSGNVFRMNFNLNLKPMATRSLLQLHRVQELIVITDFGRAANVYFPQLQDEYNTIASIKANATSSELQTMMLTSLKKLKGTSINLLVLIEKENTIVFNSLLDAGLFTGLLLPKAQWYLPTYPLPLSSLDKYRYSGGSIYTLREDVQGIPPDSSKNISLLVKLATNFIVNAIGEKTRNYLSLLRNGKFSSSHGILQFDQTTGDILNEKIIVSSIQNRRLIDKKFTWHNNRLTASSRDVIDENDWRIAVFPNSVFLNFTDKGLEGFSVDLIRQFLILRPEINFTFILPASASYKSNDYHSMFMSVFDIVTKGEADVAFIPIPTITAWHYLVDYASPSFGEVGINMLMSRQNKTVIHRMLWYMTAPFTFNVWIGCGIVYLLLVFVLWATDKISPNYTGSETFGVTDSLFLVSAAFMMAKLDVKPRMLSVRIFNLLLWFATLVMMASYAANLFQYILSKPPYIPINSFTEALSYGSSHPWFWRKGLFSFDFFTQRAAAYPQSLEAKMLNKANQSWSSTMLVSNFSEIYPRLKGSSHVYIGDTMTNLFLTMSHCDLQMIGQSINVVPLAFPIRKNWNGKALFDSTYATLVKNTYIRQLKEKYFSFNPCRGAASTVVIKPMDVFDVAGIFMLLAAGIVIAIIVCIMELVVYKTDLSCQRRAGGGLEFGKTYKMKVLYLEPDGVRVEQEGHKRQYFVPSNLLHPTEDREITPADLGIQVGTKLKLVYNGNNPQTGERIFKRVN